MLHCSLPWNSVHVHVQCAVCSVHVVCAGHACMRLSLALLSRRWAACSTHPSLHLALNVECAGLLQRLHRPLEPGLPHRRPADHQPQGRSLLGTSTLWGMLGGWGRQ